ncbi:hypothetical protein C8Q76DRAFT_740511 [Earliella scabrosa]|nr:hypothetical protein C8Q76DRAFT_740511 [Earliella scabrosa]
MIPKYSNPSVLLGSTAIVSRAALNGDSDDELETDDAKDPEHEQMVARLENILKRSIADVLPQTNSGDEAGERRRKKKRKVDSARQDVADGGDSEQVVVPFRLFSGVSQLKPIVLTPKAPPKIVSQGPALEDTEAEAERRARRAREVAVDSSWVMSESSKCTMIRKNARQPVELSGKLPDPAATLLLVERPKPPPQPPCLARLNPELEVEPSPHEHDTDCCPIIEVQASSAEAADPAKRKRRRGKSRDKPVVQPTFWRPPPGLGGKCLGYAWGYSGSRPLHPEADDKPRYERDTMKKAVYA